MSIDERPVHENLPLLLDFVEWVAKQSRSRGEVLEAWGTSCPRLPVWEDAVDLGFVERRLAGGVETVQVTPGGLDLLTDHGRRR